MHTLDPSLSLSQLGSIGKFLLAAQGFLDALRTRLHR